MPLHTTALIITLPSHRKVRNPKVYDSYFTSHVCQWALKMWERALLCNQHLTGPASAVYTHSNFAVKWDAPKYLPRVQNIDKF